MSAPRGAADVRWTAAPTRVLFVLPRMVAGGVERAILNLIAELQTRGVDCALALGHARGEFLDEALRLVSVYEVAACGNAWFPFGLVPVLRRYRPTHVVTAFADVSLMTWMACRWTRCRAVLVVGVHGTHRSAAAVGGWRVQLQYHIYGVLAGIAYRHFDAVVAVSTGVAADVCERYPLSVNKLTVILNPVFTTGMDEYLARLPHRAGRRAPYRLVVLGRLAYEKGLDVLLRALPMVLPQYPVWLDIYGDGRERAALTSLIEMMGLSSIVSLKGSTLDPLAALISADVFVLPSRHEGLPTTLIEALACRCQIVASDCPHGPAEILQQGRLGQLVPPDDPIALAAAINRSLSGAVRFDEAALRRRARDFSAQASVDDYVALFQRLAITHR